MTDDQTQYRDDATHREAVAEELEALNRWLSHARDERHHAMRTVSLIDAEMPQMEERLAELCKEWRGE